MAAEDLDGCGLLTPEEAAEAVEAPSVEAEPWPVPSASDEDVMTTGCTYADPEPGALAKTVVAVHVYPNARTARFWFDETRRRNDYEYLPGLGDLAYVPLEEVGDFEVLVGAYWLKVSVERARHDEGPGEDDAAARDVVELALSRLPT